MAKLPKVMPAPKPPQMQLSSAAGPTPPIYQPEPGSGGSPVNLANVSQAVGQANAAAGQAVQDRIKAALQAAAAPARAALATPEAQAAINKAKAARAKAQAGIQAGAENLQGQLAPQLAMANKLIAATPKAVGVAPGAGGGMAATPVKPYMTGGGGAPLHWEGLPPGVDPSTGLPIGIDPSTGNFRDQSPGALPTGVLTPGDPGALIAPNPMPPMVTGRPMPAPSPGGAIGPWPSPVTTGVVKPAPVPQRGPAPPQASTGPMPGPSPAPAANPSAVQAQQLQANMQNQQAKIANQQKQAGIQAQDLQSTMQSQQAKIAANNAAGGGGQLKAPLQT